MLDSVKNEIIPENKVGKINTCFIPEKTNPSSIQIIQQGSCATDARTLLWPFRMGGATRSCAGAFSKCVSHRWAGGVSPNSSWSNKLMVGVTSWWFLEVCVPFFPTWNTLISIHADVWWVAGGSCPFLLVGPRTWPLLSSRTRSEILYVQISGNFGVSLSISGDVKVDL